MSVTVFGIRHHGPGSSRSLCEALRAQNADVILTTEKDAMRLLDVRRVVGLRNPGHSVVKLMQPTTGPCVVVASYTHPEYARTMAETFELMGMTALLSRGLEGEVVSDPRRTAQVDGFVRGRRIPLQAQQPVRDAVEGADPHAGRLVPEQRDTEQRRQHVGDDAEGAADGGEQPASPATADRARHRVDHPGARDDGHHQRGEQELDGDVADHASPPF